MDSTDTISTDKLRKNIAQMLNKATPKQLRIIYMVAYEMVKKS